MLKYRVDVKCDLCLSLAPTVLHILNNCPVPWDQVNWTNMTNQLVLNFKTHLSKDEAFLLYADLPGWWANKSPPATLPPNISSSSDRQDIIIVSPEEISILELVVCFNARSNILAEKLRKGKYASLIIDLESRGHTVTYMTLEIGSLCHYTGVQSEIVEYSAPALHTNFQCSDPPSMAPQSLFVPWNYCLFYCYITILAKSLPVCMATLFVTIGSPWVLGCSVCIVLIKWICFSIFIFSIKNH